MCDYKKLARQFDEEYKSLRTRMTFILWFIGIVFAAGLSFVGYSSKQMVYFSQELAILKHEADKGERYTAKDHKAYSDNVDRRITRLETIVEKIEPRLVRIDTNMAYIVKRIEDADRP